VLAKGRTSSPRLIGTMRRIACICLASNISITGAYVRSEHNPADFPSRSPELFSVSKSMASAALTKEEIGAGNRKQQTNQRSPRLIVSSRRIAYI